MDIKYTQLTSSDYKRIKEINPARFIKRAWRTTNGTKQWVALNWLDEDFPNGYDYHLTALKATLDNGGFAIGAFNGSQMVGFVSVNADIFGDSSKYVLLDQLFIDNKHQNQGIGKKLFALVAEQAIKWQVDKLYICSGSSEDTLNFYYALGCVEAKEINQKLYENDENDIQLEFTLGGQ